QFGIVPDGWTAGFASRLTSPRPVGIVLLDSQDRMLVLLGDQWMSMQTAQRWREAAPLGMTDLSAWIADDRYATEEWRRGYFVIERSIDIRGHQMTVIAGAPLSVY